MTESYSVRRVLMAVTTDGAFMGAAGMAYAQGGAGNRAVSPPVKPQMLATQDAVPMSRAAVNCPTTPSQVPTRGTSSGVMVSDGTPLGSG